MIGYDKKKAVSSRTEMPATLMTLRGRSIPPERRPPDDHRYIQLTHERTRIRINTELQNHQALILIETSAEREQTFKARRNDLHTQFLHAPHTPERNEEALAFYTTLQHRDLFIQFACQRPEFLSGPHLADWHALVAKALTR